MSGRVILAIGGNAAWIIGLATIADTVGSDNAAKTVGTISSIFMSGLLVGPVVSGWMLRLLGYWPTWSTAILVLVIDMALRLVIIENPKEQRDNSSSSTNDRGQGSCSDIEAVGTEARNNTTNETTPLLQPSPQDDRDTQGSRPHNGGDVKPIETEQLPNFYRTVLTHPRALTAMACHMTSALVVTSLDTTLPLHVIRDFG